MLIMWSKKWVASLRVELPDLQFLLRNSWSGVWFWALKFVTSGKVLEFEVSSSFEVLGFEEVGFCGLLKKGEEILPIEEAVVLDDNTWATEGGEEEEQGRVLTFKNPLEGFLFVLLETVEPGKLNRGFRIREPKRVKSRGLSMLLFLGQPGLACLI